MVYRLRQPPMKRVTVLLTLILTIGTPNAKPVEIRASLVPDSQVIDAAHFRRKTKGEIEVVVVQRARGAGLLTFHLNGRPTAKLGHAEAVRLYLAPGRYRFGVSPSYPYGGTGFWQMNADVSETTPQVYRIFKSAGFTSSGGNAVYEISRDSSHSR